MSEPRRFSLVKPTLQTPLHIDFDWWIKHDSNWRVYLRSFLCEEHQEAFAKTGEDVRVDFIDAETAEIHTMDGIQHVLMTHCAKQDGFITLNTALVDAVFRVFLSNGNKPMSSEQLGEILNRPPVTILRTLTGQAVYKGLRPCLG